MSSITRVSASPHYPLFDTIRVRSRFRKGGLIPTGSVRRSLQANRIRPVHLIDDVKKKKKKKTWPLLVSDTGVEGTCKGTAPMTNTQAIAATGRRSDRHWLMWPPAPPSVEHWLGRANRWRRRQLRPSMWRWSGLQRHRLAKLTLPVAAPTEGSRSRPPH
jgi:hypothetical protein